MSKLTKDSFLNIYRQNLGENNTEKNKVANFEYTMGTNIFQSNHTTCDSSTNVYEPSIFYEGNVFHNSKIEEEYQKSLILRNQDNASFLSEAISNGEEMKSCFNFFSLPKFGLSEKTTQTILTGRDIDDLEYLQRELASCKDDLMSYVFKNKSNETLRKIFPFAEEKKFSKEMSAFQERRDNFITIKRANDCELQLSRKRRDSVLSTQVKSHIHLTTKPSKGRRRRKKVEQDRRINEDSKEYEKRSDSSDIKIEDITQNLTSSSKASNQQNLVRKDFSEEFDITGIINDIKNLSRKDQFKKQDSDSNTNTTLNKVENLAFSPSFNKEEHNTISLKKIHQPRKWDAFQYFKAEFASSHKDLTEEELDKMSRKEWNSLDKDLKKIYNMNAERERKNHKLKKKIQMREQLERSLQEDDEINK